MHGRWSGKKSRKNKCLSGHATYVRIFQGYEADTFFHAWIPSDFDLSERAIHQLVEKINPELFIAEPQVQFSGDAAHHDVNLYPRKNGLHIKHHPKTMVHPTLSQTISRSASIQLALDYSREKNFEYDAIVAVRYDLYFKKGINLKSLRGGKLYVSSNSRNLNTHCDFLFAGKPDAVEKLLEVEDHLRVEIEEGIFGNPEKPSSPEEMLMRFYRKVGLETEVICKFRKDFLLARMK